MAQDNHIGVLNDFLEAKATGQGGTLEFFMDKVQIEAIIKPLECVRGLLQTSFVYFQL